MHSEANKLFENASLPLMQVDRKLAEHIDTLESLPTLQISIVQNVASYMAGTLHSLPSTQETVQRIGATFSTVQASVLSVLIGRLLQNDMAAHKRKILHVSFPLRSLLQNEVAHFRTKHGG